MLENARKRSDLIRQRYEERIKALIRTNPKC